MRDEEQIGITNEEERMRKAILKILDWMHPMMDRLAPNEPEVHDEIDELKRLLSEKR